MLKHDSESGAVILDGELTFETVPDLIASTPAICGVDPQDRNVTVDLSRVSKADSAGLALLVEWVSQARRDKLDLVFTNVPDQIKSVADVCQVQEVLPLK